MKTRKITLPTLLFAILIAFSGQLMAHGNHADPNHKHEDHATGKKYTVKRLKSATPKMAKLVSGQGNYVFSWNKKLTKAFPDDAVEHEPKMHGGFNEDPETGIVYTGIPGYGLCEISADLKTWKRIGTDEKLKDNIHGIVFFVHKGKKHLAVAQEGKRVLVLDLQGNIISEINKPTGKEFRFKTANEFFGSEESNFGVTDVTYLNGIIYAAHGYSKGDFVMTIEEKDGKWSWGKLAWGGKGKRAGQFQTAHGIYAHQGYIYVANRAAGQVVKFNKDGKFLDTFSDIPAKSLVCNVSFKDQHYFFNALSAIGDDMKSAPIYVHSGNKLVSTVIPGDLGIPILTNIHHVWPHVVTNKNGKKQLYLLVHGWNKGKFAVLKLEK